MKEIMEDGRRLRRREGDYEGGKKAMKEAMIKGRRL